MQWTHPICDLCWGNRHRHREPSRLVDTARQLEKCCDCGSETQSGIYIRISPLEVRFPAPDDEPSAPTTAEESGRGAAGGEVAPSPFEIVNYFVYDEATDSFVDSRKVDHEREFANRDEPDGVVGPEDAEHA